MLTVKFSSRLLNRTLQALAIITVVFTSLLIFALANSALATGDQRGEVIRLVNVERAKAGVPALAQSEDLIPAANERAREASEKFSHTRPNGSKWKTVFDEYKIVSTYRGENLAEGQKSAEIVVKAWMASEGHRKNILNPEFDHIAVGQYEKDGVLYWSQLFVRTPGADVFSEQPAMATGAVADAPDASKG